MREYVVLYATRHEGPYRYLGTFQAGSAETAIDLGRESVIGSSGTDVAPVWAAVPERNWTAYVYRTEKVTRRTEIGAPQHGPSDPIDVAIANGGGDPSYPAEVEA